MKNEYVVRGKTVHMFIAYGDGEMVALFDVADLERVDSFPNTWHANRAAFGSNYYAQGKVRMPDGSRETILLHRWIMQPPDHLVIDHLGNDGLDNRRANMSIVTQKENSKRARRPGQSRYKPGITKYMLRHAELEKPWQGVYPTRDGMQHVGFFLTSEECMEALRKTGKLPTQIQNPVRSASGACKEKP